MNYTNDPIEAAALLMLKSNGNTTTKDVKDYLREVLPDLYVTQDTVHYVLDDMFQDGTLEFIDNGVFRVYNLKPVQAQEVELSKTDLGHKVVDSIGQVVEVSFKTKEKGDRLFTGTLLSNDIFGRVMLELSNGDIKSFYLERVIYIKIDNVIYKRK
jgi:hypothetical protein